MRAVRFFGNGKGVSLDGKTPKPSLVEGEAIIQPLRMAISRTDLAVARGELTDGSITLGHEFVGRVDEVKPRKDQTAAARGVLNQRVVGSVTDFCGKCDMCRAGLRHHCRARSVLGVQNRDGCFAEFFTLPIANLHPVPKSVDDDRAVFAGSLAAALHAARQVHLEGKPYVTVLGDSDVALLCAQVMARRNASVRLLTAEQRALELCAKWGVKHRPIDEVGRRADQDVVVECTGTESGLELALRMVRPRGVVLLKAPLADFHREVCRIDLSRISINEVSVIGSCGGSLSEALHMLEQNEFDVISLITRRMRLDDAVDALHIASQPNQIKVILDP